MDGSGYPEPLEKIFQQVEEESERRAQEERFSNPWTQTPEQPGRAGPSYNAKPRTRRRASISISRFGQLSNESNTKGPSGPPTPIRVSTIASQSPFYQAQISNESNESFASLASEHLDDDGAHTEDNHVTHMHKIGGRQSISKAVGGLMPRRLSRTRSANVLSSGNGNMIIGVSVEEATVESAEDVDTCCARVHAPGALRNQPSRLTMAGSSPVKDSWVTKAKGFTQKFRRKGKRVDPTSS